MAQTLQLPLPRPTSGQADPTPDRTGPDPAALAPPRDLPAQVRRLFLLFNLIFAISLALVITVPDLASWARLAAACLAIPALYWHWRLLGKTLARHERALARERDQGDALRNDLRAREERFRRITEHAPDVIYRYELAPRRGFSYVSSAVTAITGYSPDEYYADPKLGFRILHPGDRGLLRPLLDERATRRPIPAQVRHKHGQTVWIELRWVPVFEAERLVAIEGIVLDISARKRLEEQLLRAQRLETAGRIAGQVAHDFNNLLAPLVAYPGLIKSELPEGHPAASFCDSMLEAATQIAEINDDLRTLGGRAHFDREALDLNDVVRQAAAKLGQGAAGPALELRLAPDLMPIVGSVAQLMRVVTNLIGNAREATGEQGEITVTTANLYVDRPIGPYSAFSVGEYVRLEVRDTGCGIAPEIRERIFDAFFTTKTKGARRGSGLGLSIVQAIVTDHEGYVDLQSEVGVGTTFGLYFPIFHGPLPAREQEVELRGGGESVLIVDDDQRLRDVVQTMLARLGYQVAVAASGEEALAHLREHPVDLLVLDMMMPDGIDGAETYQRTLELRPTQRAIMLSGYAESDRVQTALTLGVSALIRKPVTLEQLARAIRAELDGQQAGR